MKIAIFTDTYIPQINGVVTAIKNLEKYLKKNGDEVYIICPGSKGVNYSSNVFPLGSAEFKPYPEYCTGIPSLKAFHWIKRIDPDVIHVHTPATVGVFGIYCAKKLKKPCILTYHTLINEYFKIYFLPSFLRKRKNSVADAMIKVYTKNFFNRGDKVTVPSTAIKKLLIGCGVEKKIEVIPSGIDTKLFREVCKPEENTVLYVGRIGKEKSLHVLLRAHKIVEKTIPEAKLVIIGDGPDKYRIQMLTKKLKINCEFLGYIPNQKLPLYYSRAKVFASPSTTETQGLVVLEAMACARPVVTANALGFKDFVVHNYNGFFAKPHNPGDFAEKIISLLENHKLWKKLSKNARKTAENFSWERQVKRFREVYEECVKSKQPKVSVIIPALNEEKYIRKTLLSIRQQSYKNIEIIVADGGSKDRTREIAKKLADKVVIKRKKGAAAGRNAGAKHASGEILLFVDADTLLEKRVLEKIVTELLSRNAVCATCNVYSLGKKFSNFFAFFISSRIVELLAKLGIPRFYGFVIACRKNAFLKVGGFNEKLITCEDMDFTRKISKTGKCIFVKDAFAFSSPRRLEKKGALKLAIFHALNFVKYELFRRSAKEYPEVR